MSTLTVSTGSLRGRRDPDGVHFFGGVPFADPPLGAQRFAPPRPPSPWTATRDATAHGPGARQAAAGPGRALVDLGVPAESEDCLTVAVWTPTTDPAAALPVLVWVHGGAFVIGSSSVAVYDGGHLAARGAVVVGVNYRLGLQGWLRCDALGATGNQGLADQIAALEWVQREITAFGGDPANVTVFGESAGAASVAAHLARGGDLPFRRAILQSGAHNLTKSVEEADALGAKALEAVGGDAQRLTTMSADELAQLQEQIAPRAAGVAFGPVRDGDLVPVDPLAAIAAGSAAGIPIVAGTNRDEMGFFWGRDERFDVVSGEHLAGMLARWTDRPDAVLAAYRTARAGRGEPTDTRALAMALGADWTFRVPVSQLADAQSAHAPVHSYRFDWPSPRYEGLVGAAHTLELPFVFGTFQRPECAEFVGDGPAAAALSDVIATAWVDFARHGDPGWPAFDPAGRATRIFDAECRVESDPAGDERRAWAQAG
ncbi:MAG: carboxylesterase family protein [Acidimicrobiia bacterium]|nr:carboxylesterase family protein [Acidimicrobiia bacterium]